MAVGALPEGRSAGIACPLDVHVPETESNLNVPVLWETRHQSRLHAGVRLMTHPRVSTTESSGGLKATPPRGHGGEEPRRA